MRLSRVSAVIAGLLLSPLSADPLITEFCASNQNGLEDQDGSHSDWLEIHNPDATPADLTGWYLTDNSSARTKWQFPATVIPPGGYLVVFASDKNRRVAGQELHTNFALSAGGEYLGLIRPDGVTAVSQYSPSFPAQFGDLSYGVPSNTAETTLVDPAAACRWIVPSAATPATAWRGIGFDDSAWNGAVQGIGFDRNTASVNYLPDVGGGGNVESAMYNLQTTCFLRIPFSVPAGTTLSSLRLRLKYDDGFVAWVNGQPLLSGATPLRRNAPDSPVWNSISTGSHEDAASVVYETFDVSASIGALTAGENVLAFQVLNQGTTSSDLLLRAELVAETVIPGGPLAPGYFASPTPGAPNAGPSGLVIPQAVTFSRAAGTFTGTFSLTLSGASAGQEIHYTTDGSLPTGSSPFYSGGISISGSTLVRARVYDPATGVSGFVSGVQYERLATSLSNYDGGPFRSSLPVVVLNNRGQGEPADDNVEREARMQIFDRGTDGYSTLAAGTAPALSKNITLKLRGRSSAGFPKKSYGIELHDETGAEISSPVLGMPAGEDWALIGCWEYDRAFMRNAWVYEISRQAGHWAPRTRLVEVYFNKDGDNLEYADYQGVYILCENIRRGAERVDVTKIDSSDISLPEVSGGYIFKVDPPESDEFSWRTNRNLPTVNTGGDLVIHRPKKADLAPQQSSYLVNYFQAFEDAVFNEAAGGFQTRSYRQYIDPEAWADHNLFCMLAKNVDALRLSAYYSKDRGQPMSAGPLWDFDRSGNSTDGRDDQTDTWNGTGDATDYFNFSWWQPMFQDVEFRQNYVDRWQAMRRGPLATANVNAVLNGYLAEFKVSDADNPSTRDYARWYGSTTASVLTNETDKLSNWLATRSSWIDSQFAKPPVIVRASGPVTAGQTTAIVVSAGTTVYYTTDGSDPRAEGGGFSPSALPYTGAVPLPATTRLIARAWRAGSYATPATNWSGPVEALYLVDESYAVAADLRVSAVNYHPLEPSVAEAAALPEADATDFEWIELRNVSSAPVNLQGLTLVAGMPAGPVTLSPFSLAPGERALVVANPAAFTLRYGAAAAARIAGSWDGHGDLDDGGATLRLLDRSGALIASFDYDDEGDWPTRADGAGSALEYLGTANTTASYETATNWKSSTAVHGTPGVGEAVRQGVVVNEILASATAPALDAIELYNPGATAVDLSGWYLSDIATPSSEDAFRKYRIPDGTVIAAGGYLLFDEADFNPNGAWNPSPGSPAETEFSLDGPRGGSVVLLSADPLSGRLLNFEQTVDFTPTLPDVPEGRVPDGAGELVPLAAFTATGPNAAPRVGPVQVSEIHYYPLGGTPEFVEISNTGGSAESLRDWTLRGDVDFDFPASATLAAGEALVVVAFDPVLQPAQATAFRSQYGVAADVPLFGPWSAGDTLGNDGGTVRLRRRVPPPAEDPGFVGLMVEDEVDYLAQTPWPATAAGTGSSIQRLGVRHQGSDPTAWTAATPAPGAGVQGYAAWQLAFFSDPAAGAPGADPDGDGLPNGVEYLLGSDPRTTTALATSLDPHEGEPRFVLDYTLRLDRDDAGTLTAEQSGDLATWTPAAHDEAVSQEGVLEHRRVWLPLDTRGFLRLQAAGE